jgi:hypothetical protein
MRHLRAPTSRPFHSGARRTTCVIIVCTKDRRYTGTSCHPPRTGRYVRSRPGWRDGGRSGSSSSVVPGNRSSSPAAYSARPRRAAPLGRADDPLREAAHGLAVPWGRRSVVPGCGESPGSSAGSSSGAAHSSGSIRDSHATHWSSVSQSSREGGSSRQPSGAASGRPGSPGPGSSCEGSPGSPGRRADSSSRSGSGEAGPWGTRHRPFGEMIGRSRSAVGAGWPGGMGCVIVQT